MTLAIIQGFFITISLLTNLIVALLYIRERRRAEKNLQMLSDLHNTTYTYVFGISLHDPIEYTKSVMREALELIVSQSYGRRQAINKCIKTPIIITKGGACMRIPSSSAIFDRFLRKAVEITDRLDRRMLHRIFYEASLVCGHAFDSFEFIVRTRAYSPTVDTEVWAFKHSQRLEEDPETGLLIIKNGGRLIPTEDEEVCESVVSILITLLKQELAATQTKQGGGDDTGT